MTKKSETDRKAVAVDAATLALGLKTTFMGVAMVFESLGAAESAAEIESAVESAGRKKAAAPPVVPSAAGKAAAKEAKVQAGTDNGGEPSEEDAPPFDTAGNGAEGKPQEDNAPPAPTVTVDDITKVIVAKIKQKRSNNEKIGALLKTYGVDKVSSLPAEKYEAFLTDISQL